ncbi:MAG: SH3 domain-containing protein [Christensenellaceae bacterium]|nr:SH3 domain-containing protein [Christensenellaceae bacterium]
MKNTIAIILLLLISANTAAAETGKVKIDQPNTWLNVRQKPNKYAEVVGRLDNGAEIEFEKLENDYEFLALKSGNTIIGYIASAYIEKPSVTKEMYKTNKFVVLTDCSMLSDTQGDAYVVGNIKKGDVVEGLIKLKNYVHIVGGGIVPLLALEMIPEE